MHTVHVELKILMQDDYSPLSLKLAANLELLPISVTV